jgi:hypothetical protein
LAEFHNWYQIFQLLQNFHYTQRITRNEKIIFDKPGRDDITIQKSNRIHEEQVTAICQELGITHREFDEAFANNGSEQDFEIIIDNMVVGIGDRYLDRCDGRFGISMPLVRETIRNPESSRDLFTRISTERYFVRTIPGSRDLLLVQVSTLPFQNPRITFALRIGEEVAREARSRAPNDLLQILADRAGAPIQIGNVRRNFFWNEEILMDEHRQPIVFPPENFYSLISLNWRRENNQLFYTVNIAYTIDLDRYQRLLE